MNSALIFLKKESTIQPRGLWGTAKYTPVFMVKNGKEFFVRNIVDDKELELEPFLDQLRLNNGSFYCEYCQWPNISNPIDFINTVISIGHVFLNASLGKYNTIEDGYIDFGGNLKDVSCAFSFRIYDQLIIDQVEQLSGIKKMFYTPA